MIPEVAHTAELQRVAELPRRAWTQADLEQLAGELTTILSLRSPACGPNAPDAVLCKVCGCPLRLKLPQALALHDIGTEGGLFGPIGVGEGKTLITLLAPVVLGARKPLLLIPANLIEKTQRERLELSRHWHIPNTLRLFSFTKLGLVQSADELETYAPDLIICDEVHKLKNKRAAVTRRIARYMHDHPLTKFVGVSGTVMDKSLSDFAHISIWALKLRAPVPTTTEDIEQWAAALDEGVDPLARMRAGALLIFCTPGELAEHPEHVAARHGFRRRLTETPGVVATVGEGEHVDCSIYVTGIRHPVKPVTEANFLRLRKDWKTPEGEQSITADGEGLMRAADVWRHAQEMALGLYYRWNPAPPQEWLTARTNWNAFVRETISRGRTYDSMLHVANGCDAGHLDGTTLDAWRLVRDTFVPNVEAVWFDDSAIEWCVEWLKKPGLLWTEHRFFAQRLAEIAGVPYYGAKGYDGRNYIEDERPGSSAIASIDANREGRNLQKLWNRNLLVCPPSSSAWIEQVIARTHRPGQAADEVIVDVLLGCRENWDAVQKAIVGAQAVKDITGKMQKLLLADITMPTEAEIEAGRSPRWLR